MAEDGPEPPLAYAVLAGNDAHFRRLPEKGASFEIIRQILRMREVIVSESTFRNDGHEVLGARLVAEVISPQFGRLGRLRKAMRTRVATLLRAMEPVTGPTPVPEGPPISRGEGTPAASGDDHASGGPRTRGARNRIGPRTWDEASRARNGCPERGEGDPALVRRIRAAWRMSKRVRLTDGGCLGRWGNAQGNGQGLPGVAGPLRE